MLGLESCDLTFHKAGGVLLSYGNQFMRKFACFSSPSFHMLKDS